MFDSAISRFGHIEEKHYKASFLSFTVVFTVATARSFLQYPRTNLEINILSTADLLKNTITIHKEKLLLTC